MSNATKESTGMTNSKISQGDMVVFDGGCRIWTVTGLWKTMYGSYAGIVDEYGNKGSTIISQLKVVK